MTAKRDADIDIESLRKSSRRPLDAFLFVSVIFLFLAVAAVVAFVTTVLKQPALQDIRQTIPAAYKMRSSVYLEARASEVADQTMTWNVVQDGNGTSKGDLFEFNPAQNYVQPKQAGVYFIYVNLNLTCTHRGHCEQGRLTVQVGDKLTCEVDLQGNTTHVARTCWTVTQVNTQKLLAQMSVSKDGLSNWKLELKGSGLGMFLVD